MSTLPSRSSCAWFHQRRRFDLNVDVGMARRERSAGLHLRNDIVSGPGGQQILLDDPSGNPIELFQPAR
jgi:hypothetical protein